MKEEIGPFDIVFLFVVSELWLVIGGWCLVVGG